MVSRRRTYGHKTFRDPDLYFGVSVNIKRKALPGHIRADSPARFWYFEDCARTRCVVVVFQRGDTFWQVVPLDAVVLSNKIQEPPPMPGWASER